MQPILVWVKRGISVLLIQNDNILKGEADRTRPQGQGQALVQLQGI